MPVIIYFASSLDLPNIELKYIAGIPSNDIIAACAATYRSKKNFPFGSKSDFFKASKTVIFAS